MRKSEMDDVMKSFFTTEQGEPKEPKNEEPPIEAPKKKNKATPEKESPGSKASKMGIKKAAPKSERIQALVRPNTKERLWEIAKAEETSFNELMNYILENFIEKYDERS